jgi:hypothetical protein
MDVGSGTTGEPANATLLVATSNRHIATATRIRAEVFNVVLHKVAAASPTTEGNGTTSRCRSYGRFLLNVYMPPISHS